MRCLQNKIRLAKTGIPKIVNKLAYSIMEERIIENIIAKCIKVGTISTLSELGLLSEMISKQAAESKYNKRLIKEWRDKGWITGYPSGNSKRGGVYFKRTELEIAALMVDARNLIPANRIQKLIMQ